MSLRERRRPVQKAIRLSCQLNFVVPLGLAVIFAGTAGAGGTFDGKYKGSQLVLPWSHPGCVSSNNASVIIKNNHFDRRWGDAQLSIDVAADGTFHSEAAFVVGRNRSDCCYKACIRGWSPP